MGLDVTKLMCAALFLHVPSAEMKKPQEAGPRPLQACSRLSVDACHAGREVHSGGLVKSSRAAEQDKGQAGAAS